MSEQAEVQELIRRVLASVDYIKASRGAGKALGVSDATIRRWRNNRRKGESFAEPHQATLDALARAETRIRDGRLEGTPPDTTREERQLPSFTDIRMWSFDDLAWFAQVETSVIEGMVNRGEIPFVRFGPDDRRIHPSDAVIYVLAQREGVEFNVYVERYGPGGAQKNVADFIRSTGAYYPEPDEAIARALERGRNLAPRLKELQSKTDTQEDQPA